MTRRGRTFVRRGAPEALVDDPQPLRGEAALSLVTALTREGWRLHMIELPEDGISFDEAVSAGDAFELDGGRIPVIGREALLRNKRAAGRPQGLADVAALDASPRRSGA